MIKEKLLEDFKSSMREKNELRKNVIQMMRASILQVEKDNGITLEDDKIIEILAKESKKRKDSLPDYEKSGREDLINQIKEEIKIISEYLPEQMSEEEIEKIIQEIINDTGASSIKDMGNVMKLAKEKIGARGDGKTISTIVKQKLQ